MDTINTINGIRVASREEVTGHTENRTVHLTGEERTAWNAKAELSSVIALESRISALENKLKTAITVSNVGQYAVTSLRNSKGAIKLGSSLSIVNNTLNATGGEGLTDLSDYTGPVNIKDEHGNPVLVAIAGERMDHQVEICGGQFIVHETLITVSRSMEAQNIYVREATSQSGYLFGKGTSADTSIRISANAQGLRLTGPTIKFNAEQVGMATNQFCITDPSGNAWRTGILKVSDTKGTVISEP